MPKNVIAKGYATATGSDGRKYSDPARATFNDPSLMGPYTVSYYTSGFSTTGISAGRIYYPVGLTSASPCSLWCGGLANDINQAVERASPYVDTDNFEFGILLASHGFVSMHINPPNISSDGPTARGTALAAAADSLAAEHTRSGSPTNGMIQVNNMVAMGHSFGGGGAFKSLSSSRIQAAMGFNPVWSGEGFPTAITKPSIIFNCTDDTSHEDLDSVYSGIPTTVAKLHAKYLQNEYLDAHDGARAITSQYAVSDGGSLGTAHTQDTVIRKLIVAFVQSYLNSRSDYKPYLATGTGLTSLAFNDV